MKGRILKKACAVSLSALMLMGAGLTEVGSFVSASLPVYAATEEIPASSFEYQENDGGGITITGFTGSETEVVIPKTIDRKPVTSIGNYAFYYCDSLTSITIPESVTSIGERAFCGCTSLNSINLPDSVILIDECAFYNCTSLKSITLPGSVTSIRDRAFGGCTSLTSINVSSNNRNYASIDGVLFSKDKKKLRLCPGGKSESYSIPDGVIEIVNEAFTNCTNLTSITIPDSVTEIGDGAFSGCTSLTSINVASNNSIYASINGVLFSKDKKTLCLCPCGKSESYSIPYGVTSIGSSAFSSCTSLTSVAIPDSVTSIEHGAFSGCTSLTSVTIPDSVTSIGYGAFNSCTNLTSITIPDSVSYIGYWVFSGCESLTIYGSAGGYVEKYANQSNIPFKAVTFSFTNKSTLSAETIVLGKTVTVNCAASYGKTPYQYAVYVKKSASNTWTIVQKFSDNAIVTYKPKAAVTYDIKVKIKDASGKTVSKNMKLTVNKPLTNTSKLGADSIKLGEKVKVRCFAEGGTQPYEYAVYYKKSSSNKWSKLRGYDERNIIMLKPASATTYDVNVYVKDADGKTAKKTLTLTVTK